MSDVLISYHYSKYQNLDISHEICCITNFLWNYSNYIKKESVSHPS